ncbi:MAG: 4-hydroxythreonine-4-phosphate dehydrogenase PdxA [Candidatus Omnitrophica bacterium]|nr:4-hydroxythreonine-4-phosphate dehydrogenase PdxA [Candidatus Omnitrophota bacterium]
MLSYRTNKPRIIVTTGDPAGIGPEIISGAIAKDEIASLGLFIVVGGKKIFESVLPSRVQKNISFHTLQEALTLGDFRDGMIHMVDPEVSPGDITFGKPSAEASRFALACLEASVKLIKALPADVPKAIVTAPVNKGGIASISPGFKGHTEYFQEAFASEMITMALVGRHLSVIPVTRHIPICSVARALNEEVVFKAIKQVAEYRRVISGMDEPVIGVCGLNPHCGENGKIGDEEIKIIKPAIDRALKIYSKIKGPIPADTVFYQAMKKEINIVIAMYHDQGLAPFKMVDFDSGVNMTLGLGCVRTSPDHGTAYDIAGKGIASSRSMEEAIKLAADRAHAG